MGELITKWVDIAHQEISKRILKTAQRLDSFFGDERIEEERQNTQIKVTASVKLTEDQKPEYTFPIDLNLSLPHFKNTLQIVADSLLKEKEATDANNDNTEGIEVNDITVSLRYKMLQKARQWISLDGGAKVYPDKLDLDSIEPFVKFRLRGTSDFDPWALRVTHLILWFEGEGMRTTTSLDLERRIGSTMLFRMNGKTTWSANTHGVQLAQSIFFWGKLSNNQGIGLEFGTGGHTYPSTVADRYRAKLTYRHGLYKNWVFFDVKPEALFLREDHFTLRPFIVFNIAIRFGDVSKQHSRGNMAN